MRCQPFGYNADIKLNSHCGSFSRDMLSTQDPKHDTHIFWFDFWFFLYSITIALSKAVWLPNVKNIIIKMLWNGKWLSHLEPIRWNMDVILPALKWYWVCSSNKPRQLFYTKWIQLHFNHWTLDIDKPTMKNIFSLHWTEHCPQNRKKGAVS